MDGLPPICKRWRTASTRSYNRRSTVRQILKKLHEIERSGAAGMVGRGALPSTVVLNSMCEGFANGYQKVVTEIIVKHKKFNETLEEFRDTLQQVLDSYRENEVRQEDSFRAILRDI